MRRTLRSLIRIALLLFGGSVLISLPKIGAVPPPLLNDLLANTELADDEEPAADEPAEPDDEKKSPSPFPVIISKETTWLTSPLRADGGIDFVKVLNDEAAKGVTPENNAAVLLVQAIGLNGVEPNLRKQLYERLKTQPIKNGQGKLLDAQQYISRRTAGPSRSNRQEEMILHFNEQLGIAKEGPWSSLDCPLIAGWLQTNEPALELVTQASRRPRLFSPWVGEGRNVTLRSAIMPIQNGYLNDAYELLLVRALHRVDEDNFEGMLSDLLAAHRLVRLFNDRLPSQEIEFHDSEREIANSGKLTAKQLRTLEKELNSLPELSLAAAGICRERRFSLIEDFVYLLSPEGEQEGNSNDEDFGWLWNRVSKQMTDSDAAARTINAWMTHAADVLSKKTRAERNRALVQLEKAFDERWNELHSWEVVLHNVLGDRVERGRIWGDIQALPTVNVLIQDWWDECRVETDRRMTGITILLAAYKMEHDEFPCDLKQLMPDYLRELPRDAYTEVDFRYERTKEGYKLYSLGKNGKDDGGRENNGEPDTAGFDDQVISFPPNFQDVTPNFRDPGGCIF